MTSTAAALSSPAELPADGMIVVRPWDRSRAQAFHVERVTADYDGLTYVSATPCRMDGTPNGEPREVHLRWGLDTIEVLP